MNSAAGFHANGSPYEYAVAEKKTAKLIFKRVTLILIYVFWTVLLLLIGMHTKAIVPLLALTPLSVWILVFFTWRYTQVEYEYSFFSGTLTVSRILGGRSRKELCCVTLKSVRQILPYEEENIPQIEQFQAEKSIVAASDEAAPEVYVILWTNDEVRTALYFEANEQAIKILRYYAPFAFSGRKNSR